MTRTVFSLSDQQQSFRDLRVNTKITDATILPYENDTEVELSMFFYQASFTKAKIKKPNEYDDEFHQEYKIFSIFHLIPVWISQSSWTGYKFKLPGFGKKGFKQFEPKTPNLRSETDWDGNSWDFWFFSHIHATKKTRHRLCSTSGIDHTTQRFSSQSCIFQWKTRDMQTIRHKTNACRRVFLHLEGLVPGPPSESKFAKWFQARSDSEHNEFCLTKTCEYYWEKKR